MKYKITIVVFVIWLLACFTLGNHDGRSDNYVEIGLPFVFYRQFYGKCIDCPEVGFFIKNFIYDILIVGIIAICVQLLLSFKLKKS
ncbi:hypothetical protein D0T08_10515 [Emticicia sp. C21]|nr:hypothetical protein D0T08_10515 [Emticicia sp. C21]